MPYQAGETCGGMGRRVMKCSLQKRRVWIVQYEVWLSKSNSVGSFSVDLLCCMKCFSYLINGSEFINPDSEIGGKDPVGASLRSSGFVRFCGRIRAAGI
jgi:hypothetical protein